jgi:hypothetical protein
MLAVRQFQEYQYTRIGYDVFSRPKAKSVITHIESAVVSRNIAKNTGTRTRVGRADQTKTLTAVEYRSRTKYVNGFSA